ncbi:class I SAM-dependent methyltransferase [Fodinibius salsisoli]|uniref:Methyltransferase domain-containing protein n=1 Tax=Fodinibius salsisoli TaxID=2820877 RepID=A0ABT3PLF1_9BACT|nr:class I SAM-dependent methyltransferase [Fodinibius salsisoli]MCW9706751.1 methyltransferase domain-containing protein [Fodinibius salsisoli]
MRENNTLQDIECRNCGKELIHSFADLGATPLCNEIINPEELNRGQKEYPLHVYVCEECFLVQVGACVSPEVIYSDYSYFSSYSDSWLDHARRYVDTMIGLYNINPNSFVVEIASNDGYLLQYFKEKNIPHFGVEPSNTVAQAALNKGIPTEEVFFGKQTADSLREKYQEADLILGNNVLAHVPNIHDFVGGLEILLGDKGIMTFEFPHLMQLVENIQFDTIYHEHFFYYSLHAVQSIFKSHGFKIFDVQELNTHGGSIRIFVSRKTNTQRKISDNVKRILHDEKVKGYLNIEFYTTFNKNVQQLKRDLLSLLIQEKNKGKSIVGYGAPGKGNTLLNFCGIGTDFMDFTVDRNPHKQDHFLPGSLIPIYQPEKIMEAKPDYVFILPWNLKREIMNQTNYIGEWGGKFIIPIPYPRIMPAQKVKGVGVH